MPSRRKTLLVTSLITAVYLASSALVLGFRADQLALAALFNVAFYLSKVTRQMIIAASVFLLFWILYDSMRAFPSHHYAAVHIGDLYRAERSIFGIHEGGALLIPSEYWQRHASRPLDLLAGAFYLCWIPVPVLFATYLFFWKRAQYFNFALTFLLVNLIGFVGYYLYPAAPPWYVGLHGFTFVADTPGHAAALARFDDLVGVGVFRALYANSTNVFAAMPSLHAAYPVIVLFHGLKNRLGKANVLFATVVVGIWFAAVYSSHHYILDVVVGVACAAVAIVLYERVLLRWLPFLRFLRGAHTAIGVRSEAGDDASDQPAPRVMAEVS